MIGAAVLVAVAAAGPGFLPVARTPPPGDAPLLPAVASVGVLGVPAAPGSLAAVAAGPDAVVAIGRLDRPVGSLSLILVSDDGRDWSTADLRPDTHLWDVAHGPRGFVVVGNRLGPQLTVLVSADGHAWEEVPNGLGPDALGMGWVSGGPDGYRAGTMSGAASGSWSSRDGRTWTADADPVDRAAAGTDGWIEIRGTAARLRRADEDGTSVPWVALEEPGGMTRFEGSVPVALRAGDWNVISTTGWHPCDLFFTGQCSSGTDGMAWWSRDGASWPIVTAGRDVGWVNNWVTALAPGPGGTLLAASDDGLLATRDGWHWTTLVAADPRRSPLADDVAAFNNGYVLVRQSFAVDPPVPEILRFEPVQD